MKTVCERLQDSTGMVLMSSLAILSVLLAVGIGVRVMLQNDYRILTNLRGGTGAFYYSVAGLEWGKNEIAQTEAFPPVPSDQTKAFAAGSFVVSFNSPAVTGPLTAKIVVQSAGTVGNASHGLQARLTKSYDLADGALGLRGNPARVDLSGAGIFFSGADHDSASGMPIAGAKPRRAISVANDPIRQLVIDAVGDPPPASMLDDASAAPALAPSGDLPSSSVTQLANDLCASPLALLHPVPGDGSFTFENQLWGSLSSPEIHCFDGLAAAGDGVTLAGNVTGVGILVVREADLILSGSFRWEGLVIVTGREVSLKTTGSSSKEVIGAALVNEIGSPDSSRSILDVQGSLRLLFSRQALGVVAPLIPGMTLKTLYSSLPSVIIQDYWRAVTP